MINIYKRLDNKEGFTMVELLVTIAVLTILILLAIPSFLGYVEQAQLTRIQHDVKVMEQEMQIALERDNISSWDYNNKQFGPLIMERKFYESEGVASNVSARHLVNEHGILNNNNKFSSNPNKDLGIGGDLYPISINSEGLSIDKTYKVIPQEYVKKINSKLDGTFYTNSEGKVYYENGKPVVRKQFSNKIDCPLPLPDYEFEPETGKIVKWNGTETHLVIPESFRVGDECYPVKIIGTGAFMQGNFKRIVIPNTVRTIEPHAFEDLTIESIHIPYSVVTIYENSFVNVEFSNGGGGIIISGETGRFTERTFSQSPNYTGYPTPAEVGLIYNHTNRSIVSTNRNNSSTGTGGALVIPDYIRVPGESNPVPIEKIEKGAFQGLGLIEVILPQHLEIIEDYAFAGNQLKGITIPDKVHYIGHYAFAFNQQVHSETKKMRATIKEVIIKGEDRFRNIHQGDIVDSVRNKVEDLEGVRLRNYIWVTELDDFNFEEFAAKEEVVTHTSTDTSIQLNWPNSRKVEIYKNETLMFEGITNKFVDSELQPDSEYEYGISFYGDFGGKTELITHTVKTKESPKLYGLGPAAYDGNTSTSYTIPRSDPYRQYEPKLTWTGHMEGKTLLINAYTTNSWSSASIRVYNKNNQLITTHTVKSSKAKAIRVLIDENVGSIGFYYRGDASAAVREITIID